MADRKRSLKYGYSPKGNKSKISRQWQRSDYYTPRAIEKPTKNNKLQEASNRRKEDESFKNRAKNSKYYDAELKGVKRDTREKSFIKNTKAKPTATRKKVTKK